MVRSVLSMKSRVFNADHQHVCGTRAEGVRLGDAVAETRTRCGDIVCRALEPIASATSVAREGVA